MIHKIKESWKSCESCRKRLFPDRRLFRSETHSRREVGVAGCGALGGPSEAFIADFHAFQVKRMRRAGGQGDNGFLRRGMKVEREDARPAFF